MQRQIDELAHEYARPSRLRRLLYRRSARFDSAEQFGFFCAIVLDEWHAGCPGLRSMTEAQTELLRLGTVVQTSPRRPHPPTLAYHLDWMRGVLLGARDRLALEYARDEGRLEPRPEDQGEGRNAVQVWASVDVWGQTQRQAANSHETALARVNDLLHDGRGAIFRTLRQKGRATR